MQTKIVRPVKGKLQVWLPYRAGGGNYALLKDICGERTRPDWDSERRCFVVARDHLGKLIALLPNEIGRPVEVVLYGAAQTTCVSKCWGQGTSPDTRWECVCSCAGANHGTGHPLPTQVSDELSIDTEYTSESYVIRPDR
jgi:hypothetical protein